MKVTKRSISIYIFILHLLTISSYCQNKKEQIFILERTNDSLQTEINREMTKYNVLSYAYNSISDSIHKDSLNIENKINSLKFQKNNIDNEIKKSKSSISTLKKIGGISDDDENIQILSFGKNTLSGTVILKNFVHPIKETPILNKMVLKLDKKIKFKSTGDDESNLITDEIAIYGDIQKSPYINPDIKYKMLINKKVSITANIVYAPSGNYPLDANIIEEFTYKLD
jgi:hypothetical protein